MMHAPFNLIRNPISSSKKIFLLALISCALLNRSVAATPRSDQSAIWEAVKQNDHQLIDQLLSCDPTLLMRQDQAGNTLLHQAATGQLTTLIQLTNHLLKHNIALPPTNNAGETPLHSAAAAGKPENINHLFQKHQQLRISPASQDQHGISFWMLLIDQLLSASGPHRSLQKQRAYHELITYLCKASKRSTTPIQIPPNREGQNLLSMLLGDPRFKAYFNPILFNTFKLIYTHADTLGIDRRPSSVNRLIAKSIICDLFPLFTYLCEEQNKLGIAIHSIADHSIVLHIAADAGHLPYLRYLCTHQDRFNLDLNTIDSLGNTLALQVAEKGGLEELSYLCHQVQAGILKIDLNATNLSAESIWHKVVRGKDDPSRLDYLVNNYADLGIRWGAIYARSNHADHTILSTAVDQQNIKILQYLCTHAKRLGLDLDIQEHAYRGQGLLPYAIVSENEAATQYLCDHRESLGIDLYRKNKWEEDAFAAAALTKNPKIIAILKKLEREPHDYAYQRSWQDYMAMSYQERIYIPLVMLMLLGVTIDLHTGYLWAYTATLAKGVTPRHNSESDAFTILEHKRNHFYLNHLYGFPFWRSVCLYYLLLALLLFLGDQVLLFADKEAYCDSYYTRPYAEGANDFFIAGTTLWVVGAFILKALKGPHPEGFFLYGLPKSF